MTFHFSVTRHVFCQAGVHMYYIPDARNVVSIHTSNRGLFTFNPSFFIPMSRSRSRSRNIYFSNISMYHRPAEEITACECARTNTLQQTRAGKRPLRRWHARRHSCRSARDGTPSCTRRSRAFLPH